MSKFDVTYENDDGYSGGGRPHHTEIFADDLYQGMTDEDISDFFFDQIEEDFKANHLNLYSHQEKEFVEWAREKIKQMEKE